MEEAADCLALLLARLTACHEQRSELRPCVPEMHSRPQEEHVPATTGASGQSPFRPIRTLCRSPGQRSTRVQFPKNERTRSDREGWTLYRSLNFEYSRPIALQARVRTLSYRTPEKNSD